MLELMANAKEFMADTKVAYPLPLTLPLQIRLNNNLLELMANAKKINGKRKSCLPAASHAASADPTGQQHAGIDGKR